MNHALLGIACRDTQCVCTQQCSLRFILLPCCNQVFFRICFVGDGKRLGGAVSEFWAQPDWVRPHGQGVGEAVQIVQGVEDCWKGRVRGLEMATPISTSTGALPPPL